MKRLFLLIFIIASYIVLKPELFSQFGPNKKWDKTFGGNGFDKLNCLIQTSDGGYIMGGSSDSGVNGNKSASNKGLEDFWVIKIDSVGNKTWDKTFGGNGIDLLFALQQTSDGGYILGGASNSGISGDKSQASKGTDDFWILKLDANGNKLWDKTIGGNDGEVLHSLKQTQDGGYILGGYSKSNISGDKSENSRGLMDYWVVKIDTAGNKLWDKTFGGSNIDILYSLDQTTDGGYILGGYSESGISSDKSQNLSGLSDCWIIKLDASGNKLWEKTIGGNASEILNSIQQTSDGGFILGASSESGISGDKSQGSRGSFDFWVVKLAATGSKTWDKTIGGNNHENLISLKQTQDGGYIAGGHSVSSNTGDKTEPNKGNYDFWVLKLDSNGSITWDKTLGGNNEDRISMLQQTSEGGYILGGYSLSGLSGDKSNASYGNMDFWTVKLATICGSLTATLSPICISTGTGINVNVTGIQPVTTGTPSWTLTYTVNGVMQTATGTTNTFSLATNAAVGTVYTLVNIASGTCTNNLTGSFTVQAVPAAPTVTPGNSCGTGTVTLSASGAPAGSNYIWYDAATAGNALQTSATGTFTTPSLSASTPYFVAVTNNAGCESPRTQVMATITNLSVTAGAARSICENAAPVQLTGYTPAGGTFSGPGVSASGLFTPSSSLMGNQTITYTVTQNGCIDSASQVITVVAAPVVSAGINDTVCASAAPFQLTGASPAGGTWTGSGVNATGLFTPTHALAGSQTVTYSVSQNGCTVTSTKNVVIPTPPVQPVISLHSSDTLMASTLGNSYEWKRNNTVIPGNQQKLKVSIPGTYAVRVKDAGNCASEYSADYNYNVSGLKDELQNKLNLYPNPNAGLLTLELSKPQPAEVIIYNALGQQILQKTVAKTDEKVQLDLSQAAKGIYLVQVQTEKQVVVKKIVVE